MNVIKQKTTYTAIGLMSGTSLDGLDVALCSFTKTKTEWHYTIIDAKTYLYSSRFKGWLKGAHILDNETVLTTHVELGRISAQKVEVLLYDKKDYKVDVIASHGHTVFHQPQNKFTYQIGDGATIAALTGITTVCDFRSTDIALGGQGAPLVPIGDELLFNQYDACLNIGGIANISFKHNKKRVAFDVCPANMVFNYYADQAGKPYDKGGKLAAKGKVNDTALKKLNALSFYKDYNSKSLGREWVDEEVIALLEDTDITLCDKLATALEHSAFQVAEVLNHFKLKNVLITGGGAYNAYFLERIKHYTPCQLILPDDKTIQFKEALIFSFLGVLRLRGEINCLKSVTGARKDSCSGAVYLG